MTLRNDLTTTAKVVETLSKGKKKKTLTEQVLSYSRCPSDRDDALFNGLMRKREELIAILHGNGNTAKTTWGPFKYVNPSMSKDDAKKEMDRVGSTLNFFYEKYPSFYERPPGPSSGLLTRRPNTQEESDFPLTLKL